MHVESHLVDHVGFEQRSRKVAAPEHADALAGFLLQRANELAGVAGDECDPRAIDRAKRARKDVRLHARIAIGLARLRGELRLRDLPCLATHHERVDALPIFGNDVVHVLAHVQPVDRAVRAGDESVETACPAIGDRTHRASSSWPNGTTALYYTVI